MIILQDHKIENLNGKVRLSDYLIGVFKQVPTRKGIKKAIERGSVLLNGAKGNTGDWVSIGDVISLIDNSSQAPKEYQLKLEIVFEDQYLAIINKPAGISVSGNQFKTIQNALLYNITKSDEEDALNWPKPVHRLDSSTSGLIIIAKTYKSMVELGRMFQEKEIEKTYHAIVIGKPKTEDVIQEEIEGLKSETKYQTVQSSNSLRNGHISLLKVFPKTGRTHQIRIHLSSIGFPIFGDKLYGNEGEVYKGKGLFLASTGLEFSHPLTAEEISIQIPLPNKFTSLLIREQRRWDRKFS